MKTGVLKGNKKITRNKLDVAMDKINDNYLPQLLSPKIGFT